MFKNISPKKISPKAQALVEFALAIPIVLVLVVGMLEVGRLIAYYSAVNSAAREAARYGAASGMVGGAPRFCDLAGIRAAAVKAGFFAGLKGDASDVIIQYDTDTDPNNTSDIYDPCATGQLKAGTRIVITVKVTYFPVVNFPSSNVERTVQGTSARTIMAIIPVSGAPTPLLPTWPPSTATAGPSPTVTPGPSPTLGATLAPTNTSVVIPFTPAPTTPTCTLGHSYLDLSASDKSASWDITNHYTQTVIITKIEVFSSISGQKVNSITLGNKSIYGASSSTPALITSGWSGSSADRSLTAGQTLSMRLFMDTKDQLGSLQVKITFDVGGCTVLDSNLYQP